MLESPIKAIAFFLPQYHPIPENDLWWGQGFTEWTNVTKSSPIFEGHYQPHLPTDLGFYDLRVKETRHKQIELAKEYGIFGFCYYYYWFSGARLLERPVEDMLNDKDSEMPFCLCWANENWTRRWDGADHEVLIEQKCDPNDDLNFIDSLIPYFKDPRYIRVDNSPLLIVYRPQQLLDPNKSAMIWRERCIEAGVAPPHLCAALTYGNYDYKRFGFDSGVEFPPHNFLREDMQENISYKVKLKTEFSGGIFEYSELAKFYLSNNYGEHSQVYRTVSPSWDNTARRGAKSTITINGTPSNYEYWLSRAIERSSHDLPADRRLIFINAWNEWAEGCHLEPDRKYGRAFLEATKRALAGSKLEGWSDLGVPMSNADVRLIRNIKGRKAKRKNILKRSWRKIRDVLLIRR